MGFNFKDLVPMEPAPAPINPVPESAPVTAVVEAEPEESEPAFLKARLSSDIETAKDKGYDLETYLRMIYGI